MGCCSSKPPASALPSLIVGACNSQGKRMYNEDRFAMLYPLPSAPDTAYFGVFDGHSGKVCSTFCQDEFHNYLGKYALPGLKPADVTEAFMRVDADFLSMAVPQEMRDGSTATVVTVSTDMVMVANVGDSRCVLSKAGKAIEMTIDHKASERGEAARLKSLGAQVKGKYIRSKTTTSMIAVSRAIGDKDYKSEPNPLERLLIAVPHITYMKLTPEVQFFVVASDGLWDVIDNQTCVDFVASQLALGDTPPQVARKLVIKALNRRSNDNITALVIVFGEADHALGRAAVQKRAAGDESDSGTTYSGRSTLTDSDEYDSGDSMRTDSSSDGYTSSSSSRS